MWLTWLSRTLLRRLHRSIVHAENLLRSCIGARISILATHASETSSFLILLCFATLSVVSARELHSFCGRARFNDLLKPSREQEAGFSFFRRGQKAIVSVCDQRIEARVALQRFEVGVVFHLSRVGWGQPVVNGLSQK